MPSSNNTGCPLIDRFSLQERIVMRTAWFGFMAIGAYGIYKAAPIWAVLYVLYSLLAFALVVLPALCAHCPYPYKRDTCLFLPPGILRRFYPYKGPKMSVAGKVGVLAAMAGMVIIPNFWLAADLALLLLFWLAALPTIAAFPLHYCKRCRNFDCPMNKAKNRAA
ncbi:MAG: hypothetical protein PVH87_24505 [Desulfobacteraceae bacterium]|jgi:hypothetical protein